MDKKHNVQKPREAALRCKHGTVYAVPTINLPDSGKAVDF